MFGLLSLALLIGLIWLEVIVFGLVGREIGVVLTIIGVFVTAAIGLRLFRLSGLNTMKRMAEATAKGQAPVLEVADGVAIIIAAGLLLIPGYATDAAGLMMFIPGLRSALVVGLFVVISKFAPTLKTGSRFQFSHHDFQHPHQGNGPADPKAPDETSLDDGASDVTIEGQYKRED